MKPQPVEQVAKVRQIPGEFTRFWVRSRSHPNEMHLVDIAGNGGAGICDCVWFTTQCGPRIKKTGNLPPRLRCFHLKSARELALNLTIKQYLNEHPEQHE